MKPYIKLIINVERKDNDYHYRDVEIYHYSEVDKDWCLNCIYQLRDFKLRDDLPTYQYISFSLITDIRNMMDINDYYLSSIDINYINK